MPNLDQNLLFLENSYVANTLVIPIENISQWDLDVLDRLALMSNLEHNEFDGYFVYIGQDNDPKTWLNLDGYSQDFYQIVEYCERLGYEWLRIMP